MSRRTLQMQKTARQILQTVGKTGKKSTGRLQRVPADYREVARRRFKDRYVAQLQRYRRTH